jgi:hypothetical protein
MKTTKPGWRNRRMKDVREERREEKVTVVSWSNLDPVS